MFGKKIAIYGDSWATANYGSLGKSYIESITGQTVHVSALGSTTMSECFTNCWDSYSSDIYIINCGLNDKVRKTLITNFKTAISTWVNAIRSVNTEAEIYFITPEYVRTANQYQAFYPLELYRIAIWSLSNLYRYNVINSLLWNNIVLGTDNVHPLSTQANKIGQHIVSALIKYGDEETHTNDWTNADSWIENKILFVCDHGEMFIEFQRLNTITANATHRYIATFPNNSGEDIAQFCQAGMNGNTGSQAILFHLVGTNTIEIYCKDAAEGDLININGVRIPIRIQPLAMPASI